jgi:hypothetical protein
MKLKPGVESGFVYVLFKLPIAFAESSKTLPSGSLKASQWNQVSGVIPQLSRPPACSKAAFCPVSNSGTLGTLVHGTIIPQITRPAR